MTFDDYKWFVQVWAECDTYNEITERTGLDRRDVSNIAAQLKRRGVELPARIVEFRRPINQRLAKNQIEALSRWLKICVGKKEVDRYRGK